MSNDFTDFDDDLAEIYRTGKLKAGTELHKETCRKCGGSGRWLGGRSNRMGQTECFACKGRGFNEYRSTPEQREKARRKAQDRKEAKRVSTVLAGEAWLEEHPEVRDWIPQAIARNFEFALSMRQAVQKYGSLTERQLAAVRKCIAADADRAERYRQTTQANAKRAVTVGTVIHEAIEAQRRAGKRWIKMEFEGLLFKPGAAHGSNANTIWVTRTDDDTFIGGVKDGIFTPRRECTDAERDQVQTILQDPLSAAKVHGKQTGQCCVCRRTLTDPNSIAAGIGPVCAEYF